MRFERIQNPNSMEWDARWSGRSDRFPYDNFNYLDALGAEWECVAADGMYLPYAVGRSAFGFKQAFCPLGAQRLGLVGQEMDEVTALRDAFDGLPRYLRIRLNVDRPMNWPADQSWHWRNFGWERWFDLPNYELKLGSSYQEVFEGYSSQIRRNLSKATSNQLWEYSNPDELWSYFIQNQGERYTIPKGYEQAMKSAMYHLLHQGRGAVWAAMGEGNQWLAGMFVAFSGDRAVLLFSAVTPEGRSQNSMTWLINEFITLAVGRWKILDFEGSKSPGLARFYQGFGAKNVPYLRWERWNLPWLSR